MTQTVLYGDLSRAGQATFALGAGDELRSDFVSYPCKDATQLASVMSGFLAELNVESVTAAAFAACGVEDGFGLSMPNQGYTVTRSWLREHLGVPRLHLVNDCVAMAMSIQYSAQHDLQVLQEGDTDDLQVKVLISSGQGLGTASIVPESVNRHVVLPGEGGHSDLPFTTEGEMEIVRGLRRIFGHASRENAISYQGLVNVYNVVCRQRGCGSEANSAGAVLDLWRQGDETASAAVELITGWLGVMASDMALIVGASGGIYLSGALISSLGDGFDVDLFLTRYRDKGRLSEYVRHIPVYFYRKEQQMIHGMRTLFT